MTSNIRALCAGAFLLGTSVFAVVNTAAAQGQGHKVHKAEQKVAKAVYKADKKEDKVIHKTNKVTVHRYSTVHRVHVLCEDGTWAAWNSSCAGHGGRAVRQIAYKGAPPRASAVARAHASPNSAVWRGTYDNMNPTGAIARCNDGTYWHSSTRTNACVHHGGVARWL